jgi:putative addiction module antidote
MPDMRRDRVFTLKVTKIGHSAGIVLPQEFLAHLKLGKGDSLFLTESAEGYLITAQDPDVKHQMELAEPVMRERRSVLDRLAK